MEIVGLQDLNRFKLTALLNKLFGPFYWEKNTPRYCYFKLVSVGMYRIYSITCIQRPLKGSNESGPLQQVVFKCRLYQVDLRRITVSEQLSLKTGGLLIQVVSNTGLTVVADSVDLRS